jgi:hypothetical protein
MVSWRRYRQWAQALDPPLGGGLYMVDTTHGDKRHLKFGKAKRSLLCRPLDSRWRDPGMRVLGIAPVVVPGLAKDAYQRLLNGLENLLLAVCASISGELFKELLPCPDDAYMAKCLHAFELFTLRLEPFVNGMLGGPQARVRFLSGAEISRAMQHHPHPSPQSRRVGGPLPRGGLAFLSEHLEAILCDFPAPATRWRLKERSLQLGAKDLSDDLAVPWVPTQLSTVCNNATIYRPLLWAAAGLSAEVLPQVSPEWSAWWARSVHALSIATRPVQTFERAFPACPSAALKPRVDLRSAICALSAKKVEATPLLQETLLRLFARRSFLAECAAFAQAYSQSPGRKM